MITKKQSLVVKDRRSVTEFFNRSHEVFERKFDGFPAVVEGPSRTTVTSEVGTSPPLDISGYLTQNVPPCPDVDEEECSRYNCVDDQFNGLTTSGWGTADTGQVWGLTGTTNGTTKIVTEGEAVLFSVGGGSGTFTAGPTPFIEPTCAPDGSDAKILAHFTVTGSGWTSSQPWSEGVDGSTVAVYSPGFDLLSGPSSGSPEAGVSVQYLQITTSGLSFGTYVRVFNSDGQFWYTTKFSNSIYQKQPTSMGAAASSFWVRMWVTSPGNLYANIWQGDLEDEPAGWMVDEPSRDWNGSIRLTGAFQTNAASYSAYTLKCDEFHIYTFDFSGCSGESATSVLMEDAGEYAPTAPVDHYTHVWYDGLAAVKGVDYNIVDGKIVPLAPLDGNTIIRARYIIR